MIKLESFYGAKSETLDSLMLEFFPPHGHEFKKVTIDEEIGHIDTDIRTFLFKMVLNVLVRKSGFQIPSVSGIIFCSSLAMCY